MGLESNIPAEAKLKVIEKLSAEQKKVIDASYNKLISKHDEIYELVLAKINQFHDEQIAIIDKKVEEAKKGNFEVIKPKPLPLK